MFFTYTKEIRTSLKRCMKEFRKKDALCVNKGTKLCCPYLEASVKCYIFLLALDIKRSDTIPVRSENVE